VFHQAIPPAGRRTAIRRLRLAVAAVLVAVAALGCGSGGASSRSEAVADTSTVGQFETPNLRAALGALRAKIGPDGRLLYLSVGQGVVDMAVLESGAGAPSGYAWTGGQLVPEPSEFTPGTGQTLDEAAFPLSLVDPSVPADLEARAAGVAGVPDYHVTSMSISRTLVGPGRHALLWTVANTDDAAAPVLVAQPDGSGYRRLV